MAATNATMQISASAKDVLEQIRQAQGTRGPMDVSRLSLEPVVTSDFEAMLAIRIEALRPSLERLGRFDPDRARDRLAAAFMPLHMQHIVLDGATRIGFVTIKPEGDDALRLDHLYLRNGHQGQGIGAWVMAWVQAQAAGRAIKVTALKRSDANRFYQRHGFVLEGEETWDLHYHWSPEGATL